MFLRRTEAEGSGRRRDRGPELGMDHYEVRKYPGWHHHMLTCMLAHFFLWHLQNRLEKKSPGAYDLAGPEVIGGGVTSQNLPAGGHLAIGS